MFQTLFAWTNRALVALAFATVMVLPGRVEALTWTNTYSTANANIKLNSVAYGNGLWVAVGTDYTTYTSTILTSTDGSSWAPRSVPPAVTNPGSLQSVAHNGATWVIATDLDFALTSADGISWTARPAFDTTGFSAASNAGMYSVVAVGGRFVASVLDYATSNTFFIYVSDDQGVTWHQQQPLIDAFHLRYVNGRVWALGMADGLIAYSPNGGSGTWSTQTVPGNWKDLAYDGSGTYLIVGAGTQLLTSSDGFTWTPATHNLGNSNWLGATFVNGQHYSVVSQSIYSAAAPAGPWMAEQSTSAVLRDITYGNSKLVAVGESGKIWTAQAPAQVPGVSGATTFEDIQATGLSVVPAAGDPATHFQITNITGGTLYKNNGITVIANGAFITAAEGAAGLKFTPSANANSTSGGSFYFDAQAAYNAAGLGLSTASHATITVTAVNDPPSFTKGADQTITEDAGLQTVANWATTISPGPNEAGQALTFTVSGADLSLFTSIAIGPTGTLTYAPAANAHGTTTVIAILSDGVATTSQSFNITINPANDAPVATSDSYSVNEDTTLTLAASGVLANDTDVDGNPLSALLVANPSHGTLTLNPNGSFVYNPAANFNGADSFSYKANDGALDSNGVTVSITINAVNDAPVAANDSYTVNEDATLTIAASGVLANDTDVEGSSLSAVVVTTPAHGTVTINANGAFVYNPAANFNGADSFTYQATDGSADSNIATVTITVNAVNDAPTFTPGSAVTVTANSGPYLGGWATGLSSGGYGEGGQVLTFGTINDNNGLFTVQPAVASNGSLSFTPNVNATGTVNVTLTLSDGVDTAAPVQFTITVTPPTIAPPTFSTSGGSYTSPQSIELATTTTGATIHYTLDGTVPTIASAPYSGAIPIALNSTVTIKAKAFKTSWPDSAVSSATYYVYDALTVTDGSGAALPSALSITNGVAQFTLAGGTGHFQVQAFANVNGAVGTLTSNGGTYTFTPPNTGAFAGEYQIQVVDQDTGQSKTLTVSVPLRVEIERSELLTRGERNVALLDVKGAAAGTPITLAVLDKNGATDSAGGIATLDAADVTAANDDSNGNPATTTVRSVAQTSVVDFRIEARSAGYPTGSVAGHVRLAVAYAGTVHGPATEAIAGATVSVVGLVDELGNGYETATDPQGGFVLIAPAPTASDVWRLQVVANGYAAKELDATLCSDAAPCDLMLEYETTAAAPVPDPAGGEFVDSVTITLSTTTVGARIRYTTDGTTPSRTNGIDVASGTLVVLNENAVLKAMAYKDGIADSAVTEAEFTIRRSTDVTGNQPASFLSRAR